MINWIKDFNRASIQTKWFIIITALFGMALVVTTIICYARLVHFET